MESDSRRSPGMEGGPAWNLAEPGDLSSRLIPVINSTTQRELAHYPLISLVLCPFISTFTSSLSLDSSLCFFDFSHVSLTSFFPAQVKPKAQVFHLLTPSHRNHLIEQSSQRWKFTLYLHPQTHPLPPTATCWWKASRSVFSDKTFLGLYSKTVLLHFP